MVGNAQMAMADGVEAADIRGTISYGRFKEYVMDHKIDAVRVSDDGREGFYHTIANTSGSVNLAPDPDLLKFLTENKIDLSVAHTVPNQFAALVPGIIGALLLVGLYGLFS